MVSENTNKAIFVNSLILYVRLVIITLLNLLTTRFALKELGVVDYGLYAVLGGLISFITLINTISTGTANRFIAIAIGRGDLDEVKEQFNINLTIQILIAFFIILLAFPLGDIYIYNYVNYDGDITDAVKVFRYTVVGSVISFLGVPYTGLLMAKENFKISSIVEIFCYTLKFLFVLLLLNRFNNKLIAYAIMMAGLTALTTVMYLVYCRITYPAIVKWKFSKSLTKYKEVFLFSMWNSYGVIAYVGKNQGATILVNAFFNTIYNTALGLANTVTSFVNLFSLNITKPISPQITKCYARGNMERCEFLLTLATKCSFFLTLIIATPFFVSPEFIIGIWLGEVPPYTIMFIQLLIIESLIESLNNGIGELVFASGKIAFYQISVNTMRLVGIIIAFFILQSGCPAYSLLYVYIVVAVCVVIIKQIALRMSVDIDVKHLIRSSYIPSISVLIVCIPIVVLINLIPLHPLFKIVLSLISVFITLLFLGFKKDERAYLLTFVKHGK